MEEVFQSCVAEERDRGRTVLLSSHVLSEVEALCDRISIIRKGRTVESGSLGELRHLTRTSVIAELAGPPNGLAALPGVHGLSTSRSRCRPPRPAPGRHRQARRRTALAQRPSGVRSLTSTPPTLEELFLRHYQDDARSRRGGRTMTAVAAALPASAGALPSSGGHRRPVAPRAAPRPGDDPGLGADPRADRRRHGLVLRGASTTPPPNAPHWPPR